MIEVAPRLDGRSGQVVLADLDAARDRARGSSLVVDLRRVESFDSAGLGAMLEGMRRARAGGVDVRLRGVSRSMLELFSLVSVERLLERDAAPPREGVVERTGGLMEPLWHTATNVVAIGGQAVRALFVRPRLDRIAFEIEEAALGALPIVSLIAFLMGLVLAMQALVQLRVWGAELYIADMVGVSVTSEIGPLMTAIILAARSGSSNAAQLGSMVIGEEIDALEQMAVRPIRFLVVPKLVALAFASVALGVVFDIVAMTGGALFAYTAADIDPGAYLERTRTVLDVDEFYVGKLKSLVFGFVIGVVSCALGLRVTGGSAGVARATTTAVVLSVFAIIVSDAVFVTFQRLVLA